jgi:transcriptional regulator with XRE-family HTH domain
MVEADATSSQPELRIGRLVGERLRRLRRLRGLSLEEVASTVSISHSFLSMLERGKVDISLRRLDRLAHFYGIAISELLVEEGMHAEPTIIAADDGFMVDRGPGVSYRVLPDQPYLGLQLMHIVIEPRARFQDFRAHRGYDVLSVHRGAVTLLLDGRSYAIEAPQVAVFTAAPPHALANDHDEPAEVFALTTPPYW